VLVNKSQNKTPYELFNGRTPAIGFLKPFGCHVMIFNTLDNLGKFETKGDEGYFIGYSMSSKAFRVFNKRTQRVKENLHVEFLENKAIEKGVGPNWLFDINSLTKSMNYVLVDAGTTSTNLSGTKDAASQKVKKDVSSLRYIALPNLVHDALLEFSSSKPQDDCSTDVLESSGNSNPTPTSTNPPADKLETLTVETPIPTVSSPVPTTCFTDSPEPSSDTRLISKRVANQVKIPSLDNILTLTNRFEDILGFTTILVDSDGVEADVSNMETTITTSPTPTLRIHKDHPKSQIIGHVDTPIQTRNKSKETLVDYPKEVRPIGTKWVLKNKKDEIGIVIRNKARLVAQGHTQEEWIDYDEVFAPVARIKAIRLFLAYALFMGFTVYQMHVKSVFLYGTIDEEVYVMQPLGFQDPEFPAKVYKVEKAMYGLHQAPRASGDFILVQVYVDDIIFGSSNPQLCREFKALMYEKFQMSAMGELNFFLGLQVLQKENEIFLSQDKHQVTPKECHLHAVKRIFRYLKGHPKLRLWYLKESPFDLVAYSDSDYGGATQDRKSTTRGC
nr:putative ribonuclease H-like domain-containing protein [Tanacetum cinerariifolium]